MFLLNDRFDLFDLRLVGTETMREAHAGGVGCFLLGAHFGSFEVTRAVGRMQPGLEVSLLIYEANAQRIGATIRAINPALGTKIIPLGSMHSMLRVRESLDAGEFVGMLADRRLGEEESVTVPFLGTPTRFPAGPFRLAALLRRPMVLMFGIYLGGNRYEVHYEPLPLDGSDIQRLAVRYAERLEYHARRAPYNWFTFYDFWKYAPFPVRYGREPARLDPGYRRPTEPVVRCGAGAARSPGLMETIADVEGDPRERVLLVLLPPAYGSARDFADHGFVSAIRSRGLPVDVIAAGAIADHYLDETVVARLHADVIAPARANGYRRVWLAGISIGGFGSLLTMQSHEADIEGLLLLAPYLGSRPAVNEVILAGGFARWQPQPAPAVDHERLLLAWLRAVLAVPAESTPIYVGYGEQDRFAPAIEVLTNALPAHRVVRLAGEHDWPTWIALWHALLDRDPFAARPLC